jgi:hypothetical protein
MLVQNWMASNTSPALVPAAPTCDAIEAPQPTQAGDTNPNLSSISTAAKPEITIVSGHSPTPELNHSAPSFRSLVVWGNRKVVINIPHELISEPALLSTTELREYERRVHEWAVRNYNLVCHGCQYGWSCVLICCCRSRINFIHRMMLVPFIMLLLAEKLLLGYQMRKVTRYVCMFIEH